MISLVLATAIAASTPTSTSISTSAPTPTPTPTPSTSDLHRVLDPLPYPTLLWLFPQLIPSPELVLDNGGTRFGVRWQVTPLLYSFALNRRVTPWRFLVADPMARQAGSIELFVSPEYVAAGAQQPDVLLARTGIRSYFPLIQRGENLSMSLGASHYLYQGHSGGAFEGGLYMASGLFGVQVTYSPSHLPASFILTLRIRYF